MAKYRRKPIVVDAVKLTKSITVDSEEGTAVGNPGDYLVTEPNGKQYPISAKDFEKMYAPVSENFDMLLIAKKVYRVIKYKVKAISAKSQ